MLGFATVDLSAGDSTLTVWLTSVQGADAGHTNAVIFNLGDDTTPRRALGTYMPGGRQGETLALLPAEFIKRNTVQPIRPCRYDS